MALFAEITALEPISVGLKFGFIALLYLFLAWVVRSSVRDIAGSTTAVAAASDATAAHSASASLAPRPNVSGEARLEIVGGSSEQIGLAYDLLEGAVLGRGEDVDIVLDDPFASSEHARIVRSAGRYVVEDLDSTNGTYLNGQQLKGLKPLHHGDRIRIGEAEFAYLDD